MPEITSFQEKEIKINLNTGEGQQTFKTDKIIGDLNSIILNSTERIEIMIESTLEYLIFHRKQFVGTEYFAPRIRTTTPIEDLRDIPDFEKFKLNEPLLITIIGPKNIDIAIILRID